MATVTRDRSLDEFARAPGDEDDDDAPAEVDADAPAEVDETPESDDNAADADDPVEPAVSTYAFSPDGAACAACGAVVEKRWRDDPGLVCSECKAW